jgi:hypothetical protein
MQQKAKTGLVVALIVVGTVLLCVVLGVRKRASNAAFGGTLLLAGAFMAAGLSVWKWVPVKANADTTPKDTAAQPPQPQQVMPKSILKTSPPTQLAGTGISPVLNPVGINASNLSPSPSPSPSTVSWSDRDSRSPLERVVQFEKEEPPRLVSAAQAVAMAAHTPRPVPAVPNKLRMGYESASLPGQPGALDRAFIAPQPPLTAGPLYYTPFTGYPSVNEIIEERNRFQHRPDTPELQRHRRMGADWEAAMSIPLRLQREGLMIPVTPSAPLLPSVIPQEPVIAVVDSSAQSNTV